MAKKKKNAPQTGDQPPTSAAEIPAPTPPESAPASTASVTLRGRGGYRSRELVTIPKGLNQAELKAPIDKQTTKVNLLANFVRIKPMSKREVYQYRVEFEPEVDSIRLRRQLFSMATDNLFQKGYIYDGTSDARSGILTPNEEVRFEVANPKEPSSMYTVILKRVGQVAWGTYEMLRLYNMNMKSFLRKLGFYPTGQNDTWIDPRSSFAIPNADGLCLSRGYKTSVNLHDNDGLLMNLEPAHKLVQTVDVYSYMKNLSRGRPINAQCKQIEESLVGKLVLTKYNSIVYRVEGINYQLSPSSTFLDRRTNTNISYTTYFQQKYNVTINNRTQPLLLVVQNNKRAGRREGDGEEAHEIYVIPELCVIAGLTNEQRNNGTLKFQLIKATQVSPCDRVVQLRKFLASFHRSTEIVSALNRWGYSYENDLMQIQARLLATERVGVKAKHPANQMKWQAVRPDSSFEHIVTQNQLAEPIRIGKMVVIMTKADFCRKEYIVDNLLFHAFQNLGIAVSSAPTVTCIENDSVQHYTNVLRNIGKDVTIALVIMPRQNKQVYDAIKQLATVQLGLLTQVITTRLMTDERKARGAATKIGIQIAAKVGGEPWYVQIPLEAAMVCGYDTWHDTSKRGRSFGAFVASMNKRYSRWFSKADCHEHLDEMSTNITSNLEEALEKYKAINQAYPKMVYIYRDGVGDGQLEHVFHVELKHIEKALKKFKPKISLTFIVVNKRIGARFYLCSGSTYENPTSGTVIDSDVTRKERYDFYLISASTRLGTITPTYYNIIYDESGIKAATHQAIAHKLCLLYYNWAGAVRVPAPAQYAHKLALLCGEHIHKQAASHLNDKLHFL